MADPASKSAPDPAAAVAKYDAITQLGADKDAAIITRVEGQLANSPMGWLQGVLGESGSKADSEKGAAQEKVDEMKEEVSKNEKDAPPDAGPKPTPASPTTPSVQQPDAAKGGDKGPPAKKGAAGGEAKKPGKAGGKAAQKGPGGGAAGGDAAGGSMMAALASGDGDISAALNAYNPKSGETKATIAKIKQMGEIAKGFNGQIDTYVAHGSGLESGIATAANWIGEGKNVSAIAATNPYKKADGFLGTIMKVLSAIKSIASLVGSICGKIGLILTVVGLLGMIFPPIGAAVSSVARILNIVGVICDLVAFAISGVLTGLNGVRLAQLAASGASPEEKAACADLMMSEANDAAGSMISLAMQFGPKFMKGFLSKSKGIINSLMRRAKGVLGNLAARAGGNIKNFANRILRKFGNRWGLGGVKGRVVDGKFVVPKSGFKRGVEATTAFAKKQGTRVADFAKKTGTKVGDAATKAWDKAGTKFASTQVGAKVIAGVNVVKTKAKDFKDWTKGKIDAINDSDWARRMDARSAKMNRFADKIDVEKKVEQLGEKAGGIGENWQRTQKMNANADALDVKTAAAKKDLVDANTANLAAERERYMRDQAAKQQQKYREMKDGGASLSDRSKPFKENRALTREADAVGDVTRQEAKATADAAEKAAAAQKEAADAAAKVAEKAEAARKARNEDPAKYADEAQQARTKRRDLDAQFEADDAQRKTLNGIPEGERTPEQIKELDDLKTKLKPLDDAREADDLAYKTLSGGADRQVMPDGTIAQAKWGKEQFGKGRAAYDTWLHFGEDGPIDRSKNWESAESFDFKDPLKWNKSSAAANADKRAGAEADKIGKQEGSGHTLSMPDQKAEFHAFVKKRQETASIASAVRQILSGIKRSDPAAAPKRPAPKAGAAPTPAPGPAAPGPVALPTPAPAPAPGPAPAPAPAAGPVQAAPAAAPAATADSGGGDAPAPAAAQPDAAGGDQGSGGGEPLPYWPAVVTEFEAAAQEFSFMRKVAIEFKKGQVSAKQKGVDTLAVYGKYDEYAAKRKADAEAHKADTSKAGAVTVQNQAAADAGEQQSGKADGEQNKGKDQSGQKAAVDLPEPESRGFWARIIGRIKRWAKNKAAEIFGWIQGKIADVILRGLCGVSMGDMKAYSTALKNQQARAKGVADTGEETSNKAGAKQEEVKTQSQTESEKAIKSIEECDTNITEADTFLSDINNFEQQLKAETIHAKQFIAQISAEVTAARAKEKEKGKGGDAQGAEPAQAEPQQSGDQSQAQGTTADNDGDGEPDTSVDPGVAPSGDQSDSDEEGEEESEEDRAANAAVVKQAVAYVSSAGDTAGSQLEGKKDDYKNQLKAATVNRDEGQVKAIEPLADGITDHYKEILTDVKQSLDGIDSTGEATVEAIIGIAEELDTAIASAHSALDEAFEAVYEKIKGSKKKLGARAMDEVNERGAGADDFAHDKIDQGMPYAEKGWTAGSNAAGAVANPVADHVLMPVGVGAMRGVGWAGAGAVAGVDAYGDAQAESGVPMMPM